MLFRSNAGSSIKYPTAFNDDNRTVYLDGEAYFDVAEDDSKPFYVHLKNQTIKVLGTTFNVQAYKNESLNQVDLFKGSILLESFNEERELLNSLCLTSNSTALFNNQTYAMTYHENSENELISSWINGEFKFIDLPLSTVFGRLENYFNVNIHINHPDYNAVRYTGTFSLDQDIMDILKIIFYNKNYTFKRNQQNIMISI